MSWNIKSATPLQAFRRTIPLFALEGVLQRQPETQSRIYPFSTGDGCGLTLTRFTTKPCSNVVIILHGLTTSSDMFIMPEHKNLVSYLIENGFTDVWCLDSRLSNHFPYNLKRHRHTLDDVALYDIPAAISLIRREVGDSCAIHAITHCLGSLAFMMSLYGKHIRAIQSVIANSISLHPRVPKWSLVKLLLAPFFVENLTQLYYINPHSWYEPGLSLGKIIAWVVDRFHGECRSHSCHMLSFMWGSGFPALFLHKNMDDVTHQRLGDLFGGTSMHYYRHVRKMVLAKRAVSFDRNHGPQTPDDYLVYAKEIETPVLLVMGQHNRVFCDSNRVTYDWLQSIGMKQHEFQEFKDYGHQDIFMGKNVDKDIFPRFLEFLRKHSVA